MASLKKIQKQFVGRLFLHNNRVEGDGVQHSNETIDPELTHENYWFKKGEPADIHKVIEKNGYYYMNRENSNPIVEAVVTLPENVKSGDEEKFFKSVYDFYCNDFGEKNVINAVVHMDEVTPHIHLDFIPVREIDKKNISSNFQKLIKREEERIGREITLGVSSKDVVDRNYLKQMHPRLSKWIENDLGYRTDILNGRTANGNRTILELKNEFYQGKLDELKKEVALMEEKSELTEKNVQFVTDSAKELGIDLKYFDAFALLEEQRKITVERDIYRQALIQNGITNIKIPSELRDKIKASSAIKGKLTYMTGLMVPKSDTITVIETFVNKPRPLPQQYLIEESQTLRFMIETIRPREIKKVTADNNDYLLFPTDDYEMTFRNFRKLKEKEKEFEDITLNMPKISNDTFNLADAMLRQCEFKTNYYYAEQEYIEDVMKDKDSFIELNESDN